MNEQNNNRSVAMRAERDVDNIFYSVRKEMGYDGPKYRTAKEIWLEGAKRTAKFFSEISCDPTIDEEYFAAVGKELSHISRITNQIFANSPSYIKKDIENNVVSANKTATENFFKKKKLYERLRRAEKNKKVLFAKKRADEVQYAYI